MIHLLIAILINAVPIYGVVELGWSATTVLVLFWFENLFGSLLNAVRIMLHSRLHPCRGHFSGSVTVNGVTKPTKFLSGFLLISVVFTLAHGVFVGFMAFAMHTNRGGAEALWRFDFDAFQLGTAAIAAFLVLDLLVDLPGLSKRSFAWLEGVSGGRLGRVLVLHVGIIFGMWLMSVMDTPLAVLIVLMSLKALLDAAMASGSKAQRDGKPVSDQPPPWLKKIAPKGKDGETVEAYWARTSREEAEKRKRQEEPVDLSPAPHMQGKRKRRAANP